MKRIIRLNESDIKNIARSVILETFDDTESSNGSLVDKFADTITNLDSDSARFVAYELYRDADENMRNVIQGIIERMDPTPYSLK